MFAQVVAVPALLGSLGKHLALLLVGKARNRRVGRPGEFRPPVLWWHSTGHRGIAADHLGGKRLSTDFAKFFAKKIFATVHHIANPPRARPLAPDGKLQRSLPLSQGRPTLNFDKRRAKFERPEDHFGI